MARLALPAHVHRTVRRGHEYFAFHPFRGTIRAGKRVPLPGAPQNADGSLNAEWWALYRQLAGETPAEARPNTFAALVKDYQASPEWAALAESTRSEWTRYLAHVRKVWGETRVDGLQPKNVLKLRDDYADMIPAPPAEPTKPLEEYLQRPAAANNLLRALSALIGWSIPRGWRKDNPCEHVPKLKGGDGYAPWAWEEIELFRAHAAQRLVDAQSLALYTGQRMGDVLAMLWSDIAGGMIHVVAQEKTDKKLWIPIHRDLAPVLSRLKKSAQSVTILSTLDGTPWTKDGFKSSWSGALAPPSQKGGPLPRPHPLWPLRRAGLVFHGLRKSAVVMLLEAGCTTAEVAAITGQSFEMVEHYALQVNQKKLAASAVLKWEAAETQRKRAKKRKRNG